VLIVRLVSQIVVSMVLLSVAVVAAVSSGVTMTRTLSSYRPSNPVLMRIDAPSIDVFCDPQTVNLKVSFKVLYLGDTDITIVGGLTYILLKGTTGRSTMLSCVFTVPRTLAPGTVATVSSTCTISRTELVNLFSSSWTGDIVKANTYYLYSKIYYSGATEFVAILQ